MTSIDGIGMDATRGLTRATPRSAGAVWPGVAAPEAPGSDKTGAIAAGVAVDGLLALQEAVSDAIPDLLERDRRAREHGRRLLAGLGALQRLVLQDDPAALEQQLRMLGEAADEEAEAADPGLAETVAAIRLRVRVELARRGF